MNLQSTTIELPGGFWVDGERHRTAGLRPLTGEDEAFLLETGESLLPAHRTTILLGRCLTRLGPWEPVVGTAVRSLTTGDREALLLHLRRLTLGERLHCVSTCARPECFEKMDLDLGVGDLLLPAQPHWPENYQTRMVENGTTYRVRFRLPRGADQEATAVLAGSDPESAAELLLKRCIKSITAARPGRPARPLQECPPSLARHVSARMAEADPQAELRLNLNCPQCGHAFFTLFDTATYFFQEMADRLRHLYQEVHRLAFYYHWSEAEIMGMTGRKRRRYLELLGDNLRAEVVR